MSSGARAGKSMPSGAAKEMDSPAPPMCWDLIQGIGCIRPFAFAARPSGPARPTGFPSMARRLHLYYKCIPGLGICFGIRRHRPTSAAHYTATRLHAYGATRRRPTERREGRPWAPSGHAPIFERGAVGASRKPSASAGLYSKSGGAAENPRPEPRGLTCIPADSLRKHKKKGTGVRVRGNPCQDLRHRDDRVEYI